MAEIIVIAAFFIIIAAFLYLIYLGNKNNPMSISATEDIMKINNVGNKMKITVTNIKKILEKEYGWFNLNSESHKWLVDGIIEDTLKIIDDKLKYHKNISIK
jgi:hypothetical protein